MINKVCQLLLGNIVKYFERENDCNKTHQYYTNVTDFIQEQNRKTIEGSLLPNILLWDPLRSWKLFCPICQYDNINNSLFCTDEWELGTSAGRQPRMLWDKDWICYLSGKIYCCLNKHFINSYHAGILDQIPLKNIPFILSYRKGFTIGAFDSVIVHLQEGLNFAKIESVYKSCFFANFYRRIESFALEDKDPKSYFNSLGPSNDMLRQCLLIYYKLYKSNYESFFAQINTTCISLDHTFKSVANIGMFKNKKWEVVFDSIFVIVNEIGEVKNYKLTKGVSFSEVSDILSKLDVDKIDLIFVDNCCHWKKKLLTVFPKAKVKLDLFHATQRLISKVPKKHPFSSIISREVGLIFRHPNDFGPERRQVTPASTVIIANLHSFLNKWSEVDFNGWKVISKSFLKEGKKIEHHIQNQCLSDIPPGMGTNKNERLHRELNEMIGRNRLGVETAESILALMFTMHNMKRQKQQYASRPIWSIPYLSNNPNRDNLQVTSNKSSLSVSSQESNCFFQKLEEQFIEMPGDHVYSQDVLCWDSKSAMTFSKVLSDVNNHIPADVKSRLYQHQCYSALPMEIWSWQEYMVQCSKFQKMFDTDVVLAAMGLERLGIFSEFIGAFTTLLQDVATTNKDVENLVVDFSFTHLKKIMSDEVFINNPEKYRSNDVTLEEFSELEKNLNSNGPYEDLNYILPVAASEVFGIVLHFIPMCQTMPMYTIIPKKIFLGIPLFFVFNPYENTFSALSGNKLKKSIAIKCSCGSKDKLPEKRCLPSFRCMCSRNRLACSSYCSCRGCTNGRNTEQRKSQRKRATQELSKVSATKSEEYAIEQNMKPLSSMNPQQHLIVEYVTHSLLLEYSVTMENFKVTIDSEDIISRYDSIIQDLKCNILDDSPDKILINHIADIDISFLQKWLVHRQKQFKLMKQLSA